MPARLRPDHPLRVASVPGAHPYVRSLLDAEAPTVEILPDPPARDGATDRWWPPTMLTAEWIERNADAMDVMHVHFGMESSTTDDLAEALASLRATGVPLVYTVHDLENPQLVDQSLHLEHLDLVVPAADALITLTAGAAREIERRWGRTAHVIGHPRVAAGYAGDVLDGRVGAGAGHGGSATAIVHLRDLRPNIDGIGTVRTLADATRLLTSGASLRVIVDVNENVRDEAQLSAIADVVEGSDALSLERHPRYDDTALVRSLSSAEIAVLPYRFGTHSGWAELCWDLGVNVVAPPVGFIAEQHPTESFVYDPSDAASLAGALDDALASSTSAASAERRTVVEGRRVERIGQQRAIALAHDRLYREVLR